jgi:hypothetical protein
MANSNNRRNSATRTYVRPGPVQVERRHSEARRRDVFDVEPNQSLQDDGVGGLFRHETSTFAKERARARAPIPNLADCYNLSR